MADLHPLELGTYRIVDDPKLSPEQKSAAIDALWAPDITKPATGPDLRTADVDPRSIMAGSGSVEPSSAPPAPPPVASDVPVGGMSSAPVAPAASAPTMSTISPEALATAASEKASTPAAPPPPGPTPNQVVSQIVGESVRRAMRGSPGHYVPGHEQPTTTVVEKTSPIPDELKERILTSKQAQEGLALETSETVAKNAEEAAKFAAAEANQLRGEAAGQAARVEREQEHLTTMHEDYDKLVDWAQAEPGDWFRYRDTGHKILALIAAGMFGLSGHPEGVSNMIKADNERLADWREKKLSAARQKMEDFKRQMLSPEAANAAETALGIRAAAAEARRLVASATAPEVRAKGLEQAQALETEAALLEAQWKQNEGGAARIASQYIPGHTEGYQPGGLAGAARALKGTDIKVSEGLQAAAGGELPGPAMSSEQLAQAKDEVGRRVEFPDTKETLWAQTDSTAKELGTVVRSVSEIRNAYRMLRAEMGATGHSVSPKTLERVNAIIAQNTVNLKEAAKLGVLSESDLKLIAPLTGKNVNNTIGFDSSTLAGIDASDSMLGTKLDVIKKTLYRDPFAKKGTGGTVREDIEK